MANIFVRSTDGSDADNGSTWALAKATLTGAAAIDAAGDTIYVSDNHSESTASAVTLAIAGTFASPVKILCVDDAGDPASPSTLAITGQIATTGSNGITVNGSCYVYGTILLCGTTGGTISLASVNSDEYQRYEKCQFKLNHTNSNGRISVAAANTSRTTCEWYDCDVTFGNTSQRIQAGGAFIWRGGSVLAGSTAPSVAGLISSAHNRGASALIEGVDLSQIGSSTALVGDTLSSNAWTCRFRNCKLPASWSGTLWISGQPASPGNRAELWNCAGGDTNYDMWIEDYAGSIKHETTIVHTGGASDGDTPISWKMASTANAKFPTFPLRSPEIFVPNTTTAASKTLTVEIAQDGTTTALNDDDIWLEVEYLGTSGFPLALFIDDAKTDILATAAAQTDSSETWSGLSGTNKKQKLAVTFTPQEKGAYICRVCLVKASTTVYVDPLVTVS